MQQQVRAHVPALTGLLTALSLALVFGAALGYIPSALVPESPEWLLVAIPHLNVLFSLGAITTITLGWYWIRQGNVEKHRLAMLVSLGLFVGFLTLYLYRLISLGGPEPFPGPETIYQFVYLPLLGVHILLAVVCIPLLYYVLLLAISHPVNELRRTPHARVGRIAASLWLISFSLGVVVYLLLHGVY
jgi:putative membrane protein